ncbi:DUF397 domain-containing protein [Nocardia noduli]|uniref:DUF397 domain-containing protein n=1 Tax=Nocardia noduli TaxID=2815722 RepID=UPI001C212CEC|nr:DUF397 domain-containing protein [Nocardia noduli]
MSSILERMGATTPHWFKSTFSTGTSSCVEIAVTPEARLIRDSKYLRDPNNSPAQQPTIRVAIGQWAQFLSAVEKHDTAGTAGLPRIRYQPDGGASLSDGETTLQYTTGEWEAFHAGVVAGEFEPTTTKVPTAISPLAR